jgi:hypothetical protein
MCKKRFPIATFVRHSISKLPENNYSFLTDIVVGHIAIGKGFFAYTPAIHCSFRIKPKMQKRQVVTKKYGFKLKRLNP